MTMNHTVVITGSYPPEVCGVGDYTMNLMSSGAAAHWKLYHRVDWRFYKSFEIIKEINSLKPNIVFMQYPTQGYGWSLVPHFLCLYYSVFSEVHFVLVLHEFSQLSKKAKLAVNVLLAFANQIIFTNDFERISATKFLPSVWTRSRTIKIASNIPKSENSTASKNSRRFDLAYFGHIRPNKGIEAFIDLVHEVRNIQPNLKIALIGQRPIGFEAYASKQLTICRRLNVDLMLDLPSEIVANALSCVKVVYLPFPDGISERRGTALASMANGALVLTIAGKNTTEALTQAVSLVPSNATSFEVASRLQELIELPEAAQHKLREKAHAYLRQSIPQSWNEVALGYVEVCPHLN